MFDLGEDKAMVVKLREKSLPEAERARDEAMAARMKPPSIILRDIERADYRVESTKLWLQEIEWSAYYLSKGEEVISNEKKDWLREKWAVLARRLARAEALDFDDEEYNALMFLRDLEFWMDSEDSEDPEDPEDQVNL